MKSKNIRLTAARRDILDCIQKNSHLSAEGIYQKLRKKGLGRATVFRALKAFSEAGLVQKKPAVIFTGYETRDKGSHYHFICVKCGKIIEFGAPQISAVLARRAKTANFKMTDCALEVRGLCPQCRKI